MLGRSDGVLNPSGVRFGSAELYKVVEEIEDVADCIAVGQKLGDGDERVVLFVKPKKFPLTSDLEQRIRKHIRNSLSPRHVPALVVECPVIPYTGNGKRLEVATKKLVNGTPLEKVNLTSAENAESLNFFINNPKLKLPQIKAKL